MRGISGKVEAHVALVALAEIGAGILRPLVGLGEQHAVGIVGVQFGPDLLQYVVGLGQVLVVGALALHEIGDRVQPEAVYPHVEPHAHHLQDLGEHAGIVEVEVRLVMVEAMPVIGLGDRVPGPVRLLGVEEDDARLGKLLVRVAPDVEVAGGRSRLRAPRLLEPGVLVGGMVDDEFGDDAQAAAVGFRDESLEIPHRSVARIDRAVVGDVVAVVAQRRGVERQHPDGGDAEVLDMVEALHEAGEVADAVVVGILEGLDVELVDDGVLVPVAVRPVDRSVPCRPAHGDCAGVVPGGDVRVRHACPPVHGLIRRQAK